MADRWLVFGLGNPGDRYFETRHNIGQMVVNYLGAGSPFSSHKSRTDLVDIRVAGFGVTVAKSKLYMNESGISCKALADFYKVDADKLVVIHDELDIPFSSIRIKQGGGDNGHNGLKDITTHFGGPNYFRIRMGIGRPVGQQDPADFVLKPFATNERKEIADFVARGALAVEHLIEKGLESAQQEFNS